MSVSIDVVVVSYNSKDHLQACLEPLIADSDINVIVVDNASPDDSLTALRGLDRVDAIRLDDNRGFAHGCNVGFARGTAPFVVFLNPDAVVTPGALPRLADRLRVDSDVGVVGPKIVDHNGRIQFSQRQFPRVRSTYARALFLQRLAPDARWADELVRDPEAYASERDAEWLSGACLMLPRPLLQQVGGFDDGFFMYCEDTDLCRRVNALGLRIVFVPDAVVVHEGGASAPRSELIPTLAQSRIRYARKHLGSLASIEQAGIALEAATHAMLSARGRATRRGHARALRAALWGIRPRRVY